MEARDPLKIIQRSETGWFWGTNLRTSQTGWFPGSFAREEQNYVNLRNQTLRKHLEVNDGFEGPTMGGVTHGTRAPSLAQPLSQNATVHESRNVTIFRVPEGPKPQTAVKQTGWIVSKTARRTGKVISKASHKLRKSLFKQQQTGEEEREIIPPTVRRTSEVEDLSAMQRVGSRGLWR